jgi:hypothetical protein
MTVTGVIVDFVIQKNGKTAVYIENNYLASVESPELGWAMMDMYLGATSKTPEVKQHFVQGMIPFLAKACAK